MHEFWTHAIRTLAATAGWQVLVFFLRAKKLPNDFFVLTHHVTLVALSSLYLVRALWSSPVASSLYVPASGGATAAAHQEASGYPPLWAAPGDAPMCTIPYVFVGFLAADILNQHLQPRPFTALNWIHHIFAATYSVLGMFMLPTNALDVAMVGLQETSSIFLALLHLGNKNSVTKALFVSTFILIRVLLGGLVAMQRWQMYQYGAYPLILAICWWKQLLLNAFFTFMILRKLCAFETSGKSR